MKEWNARSNPRWSAEPVDGRRSVFPTAAPTHGESVTSSRPQPTWRRQCCRSEGYSPLCDSAVRRPKRHSAISLPRAPPSEVQSMVATLFDSSPGRRQDASTVRAVTGAMATTPHACVRTQGESGSTNGRRGATSEAPTRSASGRRGGPLRRAMRAQQRIRLSSSATRCGENPRSILGVRASFTGARGSVEPARITSNLREYRNVRKRTQ